MPLDATAEEVFRIKSPDEPGGVLALDLSSSIGYCYGHDPRALRTDTWISPIGIPRGGKGMALFDRLYDFMQTYQPSVMVVEAPFALGAFVHKGNRHANPAAQHHTNQKRDLHVRLRHRWMTNPASIRQQYGLAYVVEIQAYAASCAYSEIDVGTVRQEMLGARQMSTDTANKVVRQFCINRGIKVVSEHAADAALIWLWRWQRLNGGMLPEPRRRGSAA